MKCIWCGDPTEGDTFFYCCYNHKLYHRLYSADWEYVFEPKKGEDNGEVEDPTTRGD